MVILYLKTRNSTVSAKQIILNNFPHLFFTLFSSEKSTSIRDDVNKADQASLIGASLTSLSTSPSTTLACKLCLNDVKADKMMKIQQCGCQFCIDVSISSQIQCIYVSQILMKNFLLLKIIPFIVYESICGIRDS